MFELCCDHRNFTEAKSRLLDFQRTLITVSPLPQTQAQTRVSVSCSLVPVSPPPLQLRAGGPGPCEGPPLQWVESQASLLLLTLLQRCSSQFDLHRLLLLLADVDKLLKSDGEGCRHGNRG